MKGVKFATNQKALDFTETAFSLQTRHLKTKKSLKILKQYRQDSPGLLLLAAQTKKLEIPSYK